MDLERSPNGCGKNIERSGSQPNLSSINTQGKSLSDLPSITFRNKRKYCPDMDANSQLSEIQSQMAEMMTLLTSSINEQKESTTRIINDIVTIKDEMSVIKYSICKTEQTLKTITTEHEKIKTEIQNITSAANLMGTKIASLECDLEKFKITPNEKLMTNEAAYEQVLAEITDQSMRKKNIILIGIPEPQSTDVKGRRNQDKDEVLKILKLVSKDCPEPTKIIRIGKYKPKESRAIKACFESEEAAKVILQNRNKLKTSEVTVFSDQTPFQQARFKKLSEELKRRIANGEDNLKIKYVKGIPKIISYITKNSAQQVITK